MSSVGEAVLSSLSFPPSRPSSFQPLSFLSGGRVCLTCLTQLMLCDFKNVNHSTLTSAKENIGVDTGERVGWE